MSRPGSLALSDLGGYLQASAVTAMTVRRGKAKVRSKKRIAVVTLVGLFCKIMALYVYDEEIKRQRRLARIELAQQALDQTIRMRAAQMGMSPQ